LGHLDRKKELPILYSAADIFVSSSRKIAFDLALLEAMSAGLPIIATNVGGNPGAVGEAGILVEPENPKQLAEALIHLIENDALRHHLSIKARERFKRLFHVEAVISSYVNVLDVVLDAVLGIQRRRG